MGRSSKQSGKRKKNKTRKENELNVSEMLPMIYESMEAFDWPTAQELLTQCLSAEPDNTEVLELAGAVAIELDLPEKAEEFFRKCVVLCPDVGHGKYMSLGQLLTGEEAVKCYRKGVEIMEKLLVDTKVAEESCEELEVTAADVSAAYCSIAEIYLTDECFEEDADDQCRECLEKAVTADSTNPEAHHLWASYWLSKDNAEEAGASMDRGLSLWLPHWKQRHADEVAAGAAGGGQGAVGGAVEEDIAALCILSYPARINAAKTLIELENYDTASEILELLLDEEEDVVETWYLLAWLNYVQGEEMWTNAKHYLEKAQQVLKKVPCDDEGIISHIAELQDSLKDYKPAEPAEADDADKDEEEDMDDDADDS